MDPLYLSGLSTSVVLAVVLKVVITFVFLLIATMFAWSGSSARSTPT